MPDDHIALGMALVEAVNRSDTEAVLKLAHPEVRFEPMRAATEGVFIGHDGLRRFMEDTRESFDLFQAMVTETIEIEDGMIGIASLRLRGRGSGIETEVPAAAILRFRDGLLIAYKDYGDRQQALNAAGVA